jgi:hypothetical protein
MKTASVESSVVSDRCFLTLTINVGFYLTRDST